ncbi:glycosyltransferase [Spirillospora sp. CA-294931]|uniref:glycosyltransferase n=1 Tax=Spirillospora sp. CA-294931 TaxID=3240042 RepID=UPI003D94EFAB
MALALELRELGQDARLCVPPDFREWIEGLEIPVVPIGPELRGTASAGRARPTPEQLVQLARGTVGTQFDVLPAAAEGCDVLVAGGYLLLAARSVAERAGIPYVHASYCPITLPSPHHAPPPHAGWTPSAEAVGHTAQWAEDAQRWNAMWGDALNFHREAAAMAPVADVRGHVFTGRPWLAADPTLGPWPGSSDQDVLQTGAWIMRDERPLPPEIQEFLDAGEPPVYFGFGSVRAPEGLARVMVDSARALGRRALVLRGWTDLAPVDEGPDCASIGEINQQALFQRVAAAVHHGGSGTTTTAARAGAPQVVIPQTFDQHYWARRVGELGIGAAHAPVPPTTESLTAALTAALDPGTAARARIVAAEIRPDGARFAAERLISS